VRAPGEWVAGWLAAFSRFYKIFILPRTVMMSFSNFGKEIWFVHFSSEMTVTFFA
jgi:hypothetical protein